MTNPTADAAKLLPLQPDQEARGIRDWCEGSIKPEHHECWWPKCNCSDIPGELFSSRPQPAPPADEPDFEKLADDYLGEEIEPVRFAHDGKDFLRALKDCTRKFGERMYRLGLAARPKVEDAEAAALCDELRRPSGIGEPSDHAEMSKAADLLERLVIERDAAVKRALMVLAAKNEWCDRALVAEAKLAESEAELAKADAVIHYYVARDWPRYGYEPPILDIRAVIEPQTEALDRHRKRHQSRQRAAKDKR